MCESLLLPIFLSKLKIFHCLVCVYYAILRYFFKKILLSLFFSQIWRMASQCDEEHFTLVSFPIYSMKSCREPLSNFVLVLNLCKFILYLFTKINKLTFFKVNIIFYCKLILSAFK